MIHEREARRTKVDASIRRALADAVAGRTVPAADAFDRLEAKYRSLEDKKVDPGSGPG
jgi:predicted transcriptional regulator